MNLYLSNQVTFLQYIGRIKVMYILYLQYMARCLLRFNINVGIKLLNQTRSLTTINTWEELTRAWSINAILELLFGGPEIFTMVETYLVSLCWISYCKCHGMVIYFHHNPGFQKENVQSVPIKIPSIRLCLENIFHQVITQFANIVLYVHME